MIKLKVNGTSRQFDGDPTMPLLWVLRDALDLKGTKFGCGMGLCGACTVHVNGQPTRACFTPVSAVANKSVTTIEGVSLDGSHPLQIAWKELDVPQCGYCQAGQIMSACPADHCAGARFPGICNEWSVIELQKSRHQVLGLHSALHCIVKRVTNDYHNQVKGAQKWTSKEIAHSPPTVSASR